MDQTSAAESEVIRLLLLPLENEMKGYLNLKAGAGGEFRKLNEDLPLLEAFLKGEAKKSEEDPVRIQIKRQIKELVYDVEDTIETYLTKTAAAKKKNVVSRFFGKFSIDLDKQVKSLNERVQPIAAHIRKEFREHHQRKEEMKPSPDVIKEEPKYLDRVVEFKDEETIIGYLKKPKDMLDVISITGMAGLGKSTLAWKLYHDQRVVDEFKLSIWIHVSQKFNSWDVFSKILTKVTFQGMSKPRDEEELIKAVRACLATNKFLLVLDDVWNIEDWKVIQQILPIENKNGKVLVTSRDKVVSGNASSSLVSHELTCLEPKQSWELLQLNVFGNLRGWPDDLRSIGESIANQCGGVPLTIVVIGGILNEEVVRTRALEKERLTEIQRDVNVICLEEDKSNRISKAIELSYYKLSNELRDCFLFLGMFPAKEEIPVQTLSQLWIAEGFIRQEDRKSLERSAEKALNDLINMNLLMVGKKHLHQVKTCRVHDMIREFCISKAKEENLFRLIKESEGINDDQVSDLLEFHRVCLHSDIHTFLSKKPKGPRVRSFLCFCKETIQMKETHKKAIPKAFSLLRVLNCNSIKFCQFPDLTKLILLKHITLFIENLNVLPKQISQLLNLQTLVVETMSSSITVEVNIWKMVQLRHVKTKAAMILDEKWKVQKADGNLQTLTRLSPESCATLSEKTSHIKTLGVRGKLDKLLSTISLHNFSFLEKLKLVNDIFDESSSDNPLLIPQPKLFPKNLKKLTLSKTYLQWKQHMPILAQITTLEVLKLKYHAFTGTNWEDVSDHVFHKFQFLLISDSELVIWMTSTAHFPSLKWLTLKKCPDLREIPYELKAKLQKLEIEHVHKGAVESAKRIEKGKKQDSERSNQPSVLAVPFVLTLGAGCN